MKSRAETDTEILKSLVEYRFLSIPQLAALQSASLRMARNERTRLSREGLVETMHHGYGKSRGRPEYIITLSENGIVRLQEKGILHASTKLAKVLDQDLYFVEHQMLLNWVCIHARLLNSALGDLEADFLMFNSFHLKHPGDSCPCITDKVASNHPEQTSISFVPDGVLFIKSFKHEKSLLFFVEIDRSTETVSTQKDSPKDFRQKLINYQAYFRAKGYKRYEGYWKCQFNGFRLLIVTSTSGRLEALCRLVVETRPSDFVWLTDEPSLHSHGISDKVWIRGGRAGSPPESILGPTLAHPSPLLPIKY